MARDATWRAGRWSASPARVTTIATISASTMSPIPRGRSRSTGWAADMARLMPKKDAVIIGLGWTGALLAQQLTEAGLNVVAIERGPWRDTSTDFNIAYVQDELRYGIRKDLFLQPSVEAMTMRNHAGETA